MYVMASVAFGGFVAAHRNVVSGDFVYMEGNLSGVPVGVGVGWCSSAVKI
jgi:hypothetical protein